jgi:hypothetical protein
MVRHERADAGAGSRAGVYLARNLRRLMSPYKVMLPVRMRVGCRNRSRTESQPD